MRLVTTHARVVVTVIAGDDLRLNAGPPFQLEVTAQAEFVVADFRHRLLGIVGVDGQRPVARLAVQRDVLVVLHRIFFRERDGLRVVVRGIVGTRVAFLARGT
jgi:hypothetical protein